MKKNYFKKTLSLMLVALMLMTCWVWVAPEKAEAANLPDNTIYYPLEVRVVNGTKLNNGGNIQVYYYKVNDDGTVDTSTSYQVNFVNSLNRDKDADTTHTGNIPGWPYKVSITVANYGWGTDKCNLKHIKIGNRYVFNDNYEILDNQTKDFAYNNTQGSWSGSTAWFQPSWGVKTALSGATLQVPSYGTRTSGALSASFYDTNYNVDWPQAYVTYSINSSSAILSATSGASTTVSVTPASLDNFTNATGYKALTLTASGAGKTSTSTISLNAPTKDILYDNLFSLSDWYYSDSSKWNDSNVTTNVSTGVITIKNNTSGEYTTAATTGTHPTNYYSMAVEGGKTYYFTCDTGSGANSTEVFFMWKDSSGAGISYPSVYFTGTGTQWAEFTAPSNATSVELRFDNNTGGTTATFSNIAVYEKLHADYVGIKEWTTRPVKKTYTYNTSSETSATLDQPSRVGYKFNGWTNVDGSVYTATSMTASKTVYSSWSIIPYDIGYDNLFSLADWSMSTKGTPSNGTVEIDAQAGTIKITHDGSSAGTDNNTSQGSGEGWYKAAVEGNTEYVFEWNTETNGRAQIHAFFTTGNAWTDQTNSWFINSGDLPYSYDSGKHTVTFTTPATTDGIVFRFGTCEQGNSVTFSNIKLMKKADYDAYAKNYSTIRVPFNYGDTTQLGYVPVRDGYVFDGWVDADGNKITSVSGLTASDTVYATWTQMWTVTFKNWNGEVIKTVQVKNGQAAEVPTDIPVRAEDETNHYTFDSWYGLPATITANVDVFATYKATAHGNFTYEQVSAPDCENNAIVDKYCGDCHYLVADNAEYDGTEEKYLALGHEFDTNDILKGNQDGTHAIKCVRYRDCGATENVDCNFVAYKTDGADCVTPGTVHKRCACGDETTAAGETDSSNHKSTEIIDAYPATCTENGYTGDEFCTACGEYTGVKGTVIPAAGHKWADTDTFLEDEADCFTGNVYWQECSVCHISAKNDTTNTGSTWTDENSKLTHDWKETTKYNKTQADCVTDEVYYYECDLCGSSSETITGKTWTKSEAWDHNFTGDYVPNGDGTHNRECVNAGCTETGSTDTCDYGDWTKVDANTHEHTCTLCGYTPDAVEHNWTEWKSTDAALKADGQHSRYCSDNCGATETEDCAYTRTEKAETCTEGGYTIHSCDICDHEYRTEGAPSKGHNYTGAYDFDTATDMHRQACINGCGTYGSGTELDKWTACEFEYTNTADGEHLAECKFCDNEQEEDCDGGKATCTAPAVCAKCEAEYGTTSDHSFTGAAVQLEGDVHAYLCEYCGEDTNYHGIGNKINDTEPCQGGTATCSKLAECTVCGDEHGTFDEDAHKWGDWAFNGDDVTKTHIRTCEYNPDHTEDGDCYSPDSTVFAADCETDGYTLNTCEFCTHEWKTQIVPALDHDWSGDWVDNGDGSHTKTCQDQTCKYGEDGTAKTKTESCSKENATAKVTKPTCLTDGYTTYICNDCGYVWVDDEVPATGHSYDNKIIVQKDDYKRTDRDCVTALTYWYRCDNCDVSAETEKDKYDDETVLYGVVLEAKGHDFTGKVNKAEYIATPATCEAAATYYYSCTACGEKGTTTFVSGSKLEHEWEEKETFIKSEADCVNNEVYYYQCALCDASSETITGKTWEKLDTLKGHDFDHDNDEVIGNEGDTGYTAYVAPDCDNDGIEEHYTCEVCDKMFKDAEGKTAITKITITKLGHSWEDVKYKAPTCEEDGHSAYQACTRCDATLGKTVYPATGHNFAGAYYCDTANYYHSFLCLNNCGESGIVVDGEQVEYTATFDGLDWVIDGGIKCDFTGEYVNETDENGVHSHILKCECGNETSAVCVDDEPATVEPDCTNDGYTLHICNTCNYEWKTDIVPALDHDVTGSATPNGNGTHSVSCAREGCDYATTAEKCSGGTATCKDKAVCTVCGGEYGETTSHNFDEATWEYQNDAKCGVDGTEKNACTVCGEEETRVAEGTALKHELSDWIYEVEPTCKDEGKKYQECTREGCDYRTKTVTEPKNEDAHVWATDENGEILWVYVGGDCGKGVTYKSTCTVCGKIQTEIRETDHTFITSEYGATCTTAGTIKEVCSICGYTTTREGAPATGHTFNEGTVQKKATCAQEGRMLYTCVTCGYEETQAIEKTAHGWELEGAVEDRDYIVVSAKAPTCDINGYSEHIKCLRCATGMKNYEEIPATGHADNDGNGKCDECNSALYGDNGEKSCGCICHKESGLMKFIYKILRFFWKLFGISQSCNCGATHY